MTDQEPMTSMTDQEPIEFQIHLSGLMVWSGELSALSPKAIVDFLAALPAEELAAYVDYWERFLAPPVIEEEDGVSGSSID